MSNGKATISQDQHRQLGIDLFNETWSLLDKPDRTAADEDDMIHSAHASAYHWRQVGEPLNFARSDWQLSRVYAVLNRPEAARYHAQHCLDICEEERIGDFDLAFAYEALARAFALSGQATVAQRYLEQAQEAGRQIKEEDDRHYFLAELASIHLQEDRS